jgi:hypothetical protein
MILVMLHSHHQYHYEENDVSALVERSEVTTLHGSRSDVLKQLKNSDSEQLLVLEADHFNAGEFDHFAKNVGNIAKAMRDLFTEEVEQKQIRQMVETLARAPIAKPHLLREAGMEISSRKVVISSGEWLSAVQVSKLAGFSPRNPSAQPNKWKNQGLIFAIKYNGSDYYPGFALNPDGGYRPFKVAALIIDIFKGEKDSWGMALWFQSDNSWLGGLKPQDLLASDPQSVIAAARNEVEEVVHG